MTSSAGSPPRAALSRASPATADWHPAGVAGRARKAAQRGSAAAPAPSRAELEGKERLPGHKRAFYRQELARCEPTSDQEVLRWCASVLGGEKRTGCLWARPTSVGCLPPAWQQEKSPHWPLHCRQAGAKLAGVPQSLLGCPRGQNQPGGLIRAVPSSDAIIAQYGLGAALSCDALTQMGACSWKGDAWSLLHVRWGCAGRDRGVSRPGGGSWLDKECFKRGWCS